MTRQSRPRSRLLARHGSVHSVPTLSNNSNTRSPEDLPSATRCESSTSSALTALSSITCTLRGRLYLTDTNCPFSSTLEPTLSRLKNILTPSLTRSPSASSYALLLGAHGSGKSAIVSRFVATLPINTVSIHLDGELHSTALRAFRAIARALGAAEGCISTSSLAIGAIHTHLSALRRHGQGVLFILDRFEKFGAEGSDQTVLYSILNLLQDASLKSAVIAMSAAQDCAESLEKRVKSRFPYRALVVNRPRNAEDMLQFLESALIVRDHSECVREINTQIQCFLQDARVFNALGYTVARDRAFAPVLRAVDVALLARLQWCEDSDGKLDTSCKIEEAVVAFVELLQMPAGTNGVLKEVPALEMALLLALRRVEVSHARSKVTSTGSRFEDVYEEYSTCAQAGERGGLVKAHAMHNVQPKDIAKKAWTRLCECGLIIRAKGTSSTGSAKVDGYFALALQHAALMHAVREHAGVTTEMLRWASGAFLE